MVADVSLFFCYVTFGKGTMGFPDTVKIFSCNTSMCTHNHSKLSAVCLYDKFPLFR